MAEARHTCPRRMNEWGPWERTEGLDEYRPGHGLAGQPHGCSFCGSMSGEDFLTAVRAGAEIGPTDKAYKLYVEWPNPEPDRLYPISANPAGYHSLVGQLVAWADMTEAQRDAALALFGKDAPDRYATIGFGPRPKLGAKFYTPHFIPEQSAEFWDLWQARKVTWGYPGSPYRPLYLPGLSPAGR